MPELSKEARFKKVKHHPKDETTEISYQVPVKGGHDAYLINTAQPPHPEFLTALGALAPAVLEIAELKGVAEVDDIEVRTVNFSYHQNDTVGVVITAMRKLKKSSAPMLINTPHKLMEPAENTPTEQILSDETIELLEDLIRETRLFIGGKRAQVDMFEGDSAKATDRKQPDQFKPVNIPALKAALILSDAFGVIQKEGFDKLDADLPDEKKVVCLGRAPIELLHDLVPVEAFTIYQIASALAGGGMADDDEQEHLNQLATKIAIHPATIAPYFERIPKVEDDHTVLSVAIKNGHELEDADFLKLSTNQLRQIFLAAESPQATVPSTPAPTPPPPPAEPAEQEQLRPAAVAEESDNPKLDAVVVPGYRDPTLKDEIAARRAVAQETVRTARTGRASTAEALKV